MCMSYGWYVVLHTTLPGNTPSAMSQDWSLKQPSPEWTSASRQHSQSSTKNPSVALTTSFHLLQYRSLSEGSLLALHLLRENCKLREMYRGEIRNLPVGWYLFENWHLMGSRWDLLSYEHSPWSYAAVWWKSKTSSFPLFHCL